MDIYSLLNKHICARYHVGALGNKNGAKWFSMLKNLHFYSKYKEYGRNVKRANQNGTQKRINVK